MTIERTPDEVIVRLSSKMDIEELQQLLNYLIYKETTAGSLATQDDADMLTKEVKKGRWQQSRDRYVR